LPAIRRNISARTLLIAFGGRLIWRLSQIEQTSALSGAQENAALRPRAA
jgi:hypothetical protein